MKTDNHYQHNSQINSTYKIKKKGSKAMVKAINKYIFEPDYAVAPGETLRETMEAGLAF